MRFALTTRPTMIHPYVRGIMRCTPLFVASLARASQTTYRSPTTARTRGLQGIR